MEAGPQEPGEVVRTGEEEDLPEARSRPEVGLWTVDWRQDRKAGARRMRTEEDLPQGPGANLASGLCPC